MNPLLAQLQQLEVELHHPGVRCSAARLDQLLHPEFHEVGRSGTRYDRSTVIRYLAALKAHPRVESDGFALRPLGDRHALLTYRSASRQADGTLALHTLRSSIWEFGTGKWQLLYHQGTPAGEPW